MSNTTHPNAFWAEAKAKRLQATNLIDEARQFEKRAKELEVELGLRDPEPIETDETKAVDTGSKPLQKTK